MPAPAASWTDTLGFDGAPGLLEVWTPFNDFNQNVDLAWNLDAPLDLTGMLLLARLQIVDGFVTGEGAAGEAFVYAKIGADWFLGRGPWTNIVQDDNGAWVELEFELDSPDHFGDGFDPTAVQGIRVWLSTGGAIGDPDPTETTAYIDQITVLPL